ncbi:LysM peptidoglycan-binding domain-containing protein [Haloferula sp.]|uniref:LysM peptidoglycan-binding domain-containing protein n=1 Tax=Haloferula sp. TaxID=2497595 RepID=UPI003C786205
MAFKIVAGVSFLVLLIVAIWLGGKLAESRLEIEGLRGRLESLTAEAVADEASVAAQANAQTELAALKEALSTMNGKMELLQKQSAHEREEVLREGARELETLTAGFAKALSRFGLSRKELETLLEDLPTEDRLRLLEQITVPKVVDPVEVEKPSPTEAEVKAPTNDESEKMPSLISKHEPTKVLGQVVVEDEPEGEPATEESMKNDEPKLVTYTVKRGDNLTRIGRRFDVNVAQLMKLNGIVDANRLEIGQVLKIPQN